MTTEKDKIKGMLLMFKGMLSDLPEEQQRKAKAYCEELRLTIKNDPELWTIAISMVYMEIAIKMEEENGSLG